ncbi:MAG: hypothetical protein ABI194_02945, partial [Gemmatimonadaceae bacterium]
WGSTTGGDGGANPPSGAIIYYRLGAGTDSAKVTLDIVDASNATVRSYGSVARRSVAKATGANEVAAKASAPAAPDSTSSIPGSSGMHRVVWDLRAARLDVPKGMTFFGATTGPLVAPGNYTVRLTADGRTFTAPLQVLQDPRGNLTPAQLADQSRTMQTIAGRANAIFRDAKRLNDVRDQVKMIAAHASDLPNSDSVSSAGARLAARLDSLSVDLVQPMHTNGQDIINFPNGVVDQWLFLASEVNGSYMPVTNGAKQRLADLEREWSAVETRVNDLLGPQVSAFNTMLQGKAIVIVPQRGQE